MLQVKGRDVYNNQVMAWNTDARVRAETTR